MGDEGEPEFKLNDSQVNGEYHINYLNLQKENLILNI